MPRIASLAAICGILASASRAQENPSAVEENPLKIELVSGVKAMTPGRPFHVALRLRHNPGDHTYWKFPGIVGVPTGIEWKLPEGFEAGPIEWPEPEVVLMYQIKAQGYEGEVLLPVRITPPRSLTPGRTIVLAGRASWMCCGRTCHPGFKDLSLALPVSAEPGAADERWSAAIARARASVPAPLEGWKAEAARHQGKVHLRLTALGEPARRRAAVIRRLRFFTDDGLINADKEQIFSQPEPGVLALDLRVSEYATDPGAPELLGVLQTPEGWSADGTVKSATVRVKIDD